MAASLPGPYQIDYEFLIAGLTHHTRFNCFVVGTPVAGTPDTDIEVQTKSGGVTSFQDAAADLWAYIRPEFSTSYSVTSVTLWRFVPGTLVKTYVSSLSITLPAGLAGSAYVAAHSRIFTFRTGAGGIMKAVFIEDSGGAMTQSPLVANVAGTAPQQLAAFMISAGGWAIGADNSYPVVPLRDSGSNNNAVERKRYRP